MREGGHEERARLRSRGKDGGHTCARCTLPTGRFNIAAEIVNSSRLIVSEPSSICTHCDKKTQVQCNNNMRWRYFGSSAVSDLFDVRFKH